MIEEKRFNINTKSQSLQELSNELEKLKGEAGGDGFVIKEDLASTLAIYPMTTFMHSITRDLNLKHTFENLEKKNKIKYSELPNFKLLKNLGHALDSFDQLFKVNEALFDKFQDEMMKLEETYLSNINDIDRNISNVTSIHVYLRNSNNDFNPSEVSDRKIFVENLHATRTSYIEHDEKFMLTKKLSIGEIKFEVCKALNVSIEEYVVLNKNLELMIYCVDLYQEIFLRNLQKGFIENSSRFFQFNPYYNVNLLHVFLK